MRYSFTSRSLFHEARLLRFAAEAPKSEPAPDPIDKMDPAAMLDEFRGLEKDGPGGLEKKVDVLDTQLKDTVNECKDMLARMREKPGKAWQDMADRFQENMSKAFTGSKLPAEKIQGLTAVLAKAAGDVATLEDGLKPRESLDAKQAQEYDNISKETKSIVDAIRVGDTGTADMQLRIVNEMLGAADPAVRTAWINQMRVNREGTVVIADDGTRHSFRLDEGKTQFVIEHLNVRGAGKQQEAPAEPQNPAQVDAAPAGPAPSLDAGLRPNELSETQRGALNIAHEMTAAVTKGDMATMEAKLADLNVYLTDMDPAESRALTDAWKLTLEDGRQSFGRVMVDDKQRDVIFYMDGETLKSRVSVPVDAKQQAAPENAQDGGSLEMKLDLNDAEAQGMVEGFRSQIPEIMQQLDLTLENVQQMLPELQVLLDKHVGTLVAVGREGVTPQEIERVFAQPNVDNVVAEIQKLGAEKGWSAELTEDVSVMANDFSEFVDNAKAKLNGADKQKPRTGLGDLLPAEGGVPAAGEKPADGAAEKPGNALRGALNEKVEMTKEEKDAIVAEGKSLIEEFKQNDNPTESQKEQLRGRLMMAGVNADGGVDKLIADPNKVEAKEGTAMQVGLNRLMGLIVFVVAVIKEMKDTVNGKTDETPEGKERSRIMRDMFAITGGIAEKNQDQAFSANDSATDLQTLSKLDAEYEKSLKAANFSQADITTLVDELHTSQIDKVGTVQDQDDQTFKKLSFDDATKQYVFIPDEDAPADGAAKQKEKPADKKEESTEASRERDLQTAKETTDEAILQADALVDVDDAARRPAIEAALKAIDEEIALMNEGELSSEDMVKRMEDLTAKADAYRADLAAMAPADKPADAPEAPAPNFEQMEAERFDLTKQLDALNAKPLGEFKTEEEAVNAVKERKALEKKISDLDAAIKELKEPKAEAPAVEQPKPAEPAAEQPKPVVEAVDITNDVTALNPKE